MVTKANHYFFLFLSFLLTSPAFSEDSAAKWALPDAPAKGIFDADSIPHKLLVYCGYVVVAIAGMAAIGCFISFANHMKNGHTDQAGKAIIGGIIVAGATYIVGSIFL